MKKSIIKECIPEILVIVVAIVTLVTILTVIYFDRQKEVETFNNGYCIECNNELTYVDTTYRIYYGYEHIYVCDNCGKLIQTPSEPQKLPHYTK